LKLRRLSNVPSPDHDPRSSDAGVDQAELLARVSWLGRRWILITGTARFFLLAVLFVQLTVFLETSALFWGPYAPWRPTRMILAIAGVTLLSWLAWVFTRAAVVHIAGWLVERVSGEPFLLEPGMAIGRHIHPTYWGTLKRSLRNWFRWGPGLFRGRRDGVYAPLPPDLADAGAMIFSRILGTTDEDPEDPVVVHDRKLREEWLELLMRPESLAQLPLCAQNAVFFNLPWYQAWKAARGRGVPPASDPCWRAADRS